jgi:YidC/Oxa1 family membrane protein insertase
MTGAAAALLMLAGTAGAASATLDGDWQRLEVALEGGLPSAWLACGTRPRCAARDGQVLVGGDGGGSLHWHVSGDPGLTETLNRLPYRVVAVPSSGAAALVLEAEDPRDGTRLVQRYAFSDGGRLLAVDWQLPAGAELRLASGAAMLPATLPGFGSVYARLAAVAVSAGGQQALATGPAAAGEWLGLRSRFWAWLLRPTSPLAVTPRAGADGHWELALSADGGRVAGEFYAGPLSRSELVLVAPELAGLLFAGVWSWLRWLALGLLWMLDGLMALVGSAGLAIILLSLAVKLLMAPLTALAERWQREVNRIQGLLQPELEEVRRSARGEEAHRRTLEVYRRHGVSPWFTLRSLAGFLIQIPVFIAAFHMLGENFALSEAGFLWIADLARPDEWLPLPLALPFFGAWLNLLPCLMTLLTVVAARLDEDPRLTPALVARQRRNLYGLALAFFLLFYTFPAGMVLYWTANNFWHLVRMRIDRARQAHARAG